MNETLTICRNCRREIFLSNAGAWWSETPELSRFCNGNNMPHDPQGEDQDDVFPEWDAAAELADDARRGK